LSVLFLGKTWSFVLGVGLVVLSLAAFLTYSLQGATRTLYLPGPTTNGHYQIELECTACHSETFADRGAIQKACVGCHGSELKEAVDSHPETKFTDPRNASRVAVLDARFCVTCHREHRPEATGNMGLSLPDDYCYRCHESIGDERKTHRGLSFDSCQSAGCHNFHDNRALYEDFLTKHLHEPELVSDPRLLARSPGKPARALGPNDADAPATHGLSKLELLAWARSSHAAGGVNCSDCHLKGPAYKEKVVDERCAECHEEERAGYLLGKHGMREAQGLPKLAVADARQPMRANAAERTLGCTACHGAHAFDTRKAAVDACLGCHADQHSENYRNSRHAALFRDDPSGRSGASCATCHLPRVEQGKRVRV